MKPTRSSLPALAALFFAAMLLLAACSKSNNGSSGSTDSLTAMVGGSSFTAIHPAGAYVATLHQLFVIGYYIQSNDTTGIQIEIPYIPAVNHPFSTDSTGAVLTYIAGGKKYDASIAIPHSSAIFLLTTADTVDHTIAGTFSGLVYNEASPRDSIAITKGKFASTYSVQ